MGIDEALDRAVHIASLKEAEIRGSRTARLLVGIGGKFASGKTNAAQALVDALGFERMALAGELRRAAYAVADWIADLDGPHMGQGIFGLLGEQMKDKSSPVGRRWLQWFGTELGRSILPDLWIRALLRKVEQTAGPVVVDDLRFRNEAKALRAAGFLLVRVEIDEVARRERIAHIYPDYDRALLAHPSETDLDGWTGWDLVLDGAAPIEENRRDIVTWARKMMP